MFKIVQMAGFFAAHGILSVSDGEPLMPTLGYEHANGDRVMNRIIDTDIADAAQAGQEALRAGEPGWVRAVLVIDAYLHLDQGRTDALIVDAVEYGPDRHSMKVAVPYRPSQSPQGFGVFRPRFIEVLGVAEPDYVLLGDTFFAGVDSHEQGAAVWTAHLVDESI